MYWPVIWSALLIFVLRLVGVSLGTIRMMLVMRDRRMLAALMGFVEATVWIVAVGLVIDDIDTIWNVLAYSGGFAAGTLLGAWIEGRLALGHMCVRVVSMDMGAEIAEKVRQSGHGATELKAEGLSGPVCLIEIVAPRKHLGDIVRLINSVDSTAFVTIEDARQVTRGYHRLVK
jgi:uncharacterized protein YebE (UPF0316 family)